MVKKSTGATSQSMWERLQPYSIVLVNRTNKTVIGYAVQWSFSMRYEAAWLIAITMASQMPCWMMENPKLPQAIVSIPRW